LAKETLKEKNHRRASGDRRVFWGQKAQTQVAFWQQFSFLKKADWLFDSCRHSRENGNPG
jgi:hypothetical protein